MLSSRLNFTLRRVTAPGLTWGVTLGPDPRNASHWGGIVRMLADGRADIYTGGLTIAEDRGKVKRLPLSAQWLAERLLPHLTKKGETIRSTIVRTVVTKMPATMKDSALLFLI